MPLAMEPSSKSSRTAHLTVPPEHAGKRLDLFLTSQLPKFSRNQVQSLIERGLVVPDVPVKVFKAGLTVLAGQSFTVTLPPSQKPDMPAQALDLDVVFEDKDLLVINKPVGLVVHPGAGNPDQTLMNALIAHCPDIAGVGGVQRPGLVHRLDKDTSGLLVVAKSDVAYKSLIQQLKGRKLSREYLGIVEGKLEGKGTVDAPIGRHASARKKMAVRPETGKKAVTHFVTLQAVEEASLLHLKLETGRTHQIRVHMAFIHHPILGDGVYGKPKEGADRQMLHAFRLTLRHPRTGLTKTYSAKPPADFIQCLKSSGLRAPTWEKVRWE